MMNWGAGIIGGGILEAAGAAYSGAQTARGYKSTARAKEREAKQSLETSRWDQLRLLDEGRRLLATQRSLYGQAGVRLEGTPTDIIAESRKENLTERMNRVRTGTWEHESLLREARDLRRAAKASRRSGILGGVSSLGSIFTSF